MKTNAKHPFPHRHAISWLLIGLLSLNSAHAITKGPTEDSFWYYEIGGAEPVSAPANPSVVSVTLGGSAQLGLGYSCGKFDPVAAVTNTLNDIGAGIDNMMNAMTAAASAAIAALPALILQRANPGLYDMFQNALLQAEETMQLATKSCEQMEAEIAQGKNPYADLITLSKGNDWKLQMGVGGNDAVTAKDAVETSNGDNGVPWIGGQAGGSGQPVLEFTGDIVKAGYNINMNRPITTAGPVPPASATRLTEIWTTPTEARNWVVDVVGENIVTTCDTCRKDSIPGTGLLPKLNQEATTVTTEIQNLVSGATPPTLANLDKYYCPRCGYHPPGHRGDSGDAGLRAEPHHGPAGVRDQYGPHGGEGAVRPPFAAFRPPGARGLCHRGGPRARGQIHCRDGQGDREPVVRDPGAQGGGFRHDCDLAATRRGPSAVVPGKRQKYQPSTHVR